MTPTLLGGPRDNELADGFSTVFIALFIFICILFYYSSDKDLQKERTYKNGSCVDGDTFGTLLLSLTLFMFNTLLANNVYDVYNIIFLY